MTRWRSSDDRGGGVPVWYTAPMEKAIGAAAAGLGYLVRFVLLVWAPAMRAAGFALMVYSVSLFDQRAAYGFAGLCLFIFAMQIRTGGKRR